MISQIILDTDIGTDVDDCLALALILSSPELELKGITCVYGDVDLRARFATKMLQHHQTSGIPVTAGMRRPLLNKRPVYWEGHEGGGMLTPEDDSLSYSAEFAPDFIVRMAKAQPGQLHLIAIGPLTNVAMALLREPELPLSHITLMGGSLRRMGRAHFPYAEHNIVSDPEAAHIVMASGIPTTIVPLDLTTQVRLNADGVRRIHAGGTTFHHAVADQVERHPHYREHGWTFLHDPLAVAAVIDSSFIGVQSVHVDVELAGEFAAGTTFMREVSESSVRVGVSVDVQRFEAFLVERLERRAQQES